MSKLQMPAGVALPESDRPTALRTWGLRVGLVLLAALVLWGGYLMVQKLSHGSTGPRRQIAKMTLVPDTPPPPPPKEQPKKEQPKDEPKQVMQQDQQKPAEAPPPPANEPIKMEGAAGDGPSAFGAGKVTREATGGATSGGVPSNGGTNSDRARDRFYANSVRQLLRDEVEKHLRADKGEQTATFLLWIESDGRIRRFALDASGDTPRDPDVQLALDKAAGSLKLPPPGAVTQPLRFRLTLRAQG